MIRLSPREIVIPAEVEIQCSVRGLQGRRPEDDTIFLSAVPGHLATDDRVCPQ